MAPEPLRIGLVVDGLSVPAWQAAIVQALGADPGFERTLLVVNREGSSQPARHVVLAAYDVFDRFLDRGSNTFLGTTALEPAGTPIVEWSHHGTAELVQLLGDRHLDVVLNLSAHEAGPGLTAAVRCGVWTIRFGEDRHRGRELPELTEMADPGSLVTATLEATGADGSVRVAGRATCGVHPYSALRTRCVLAAAAVNLTLARLRAVRDLGPGWLARLPSIPEPSPASPPRSPGGWRLAHAAARMVARVARRLPEKLVRDDFYWSVAVAPRPPQAGLEAVMRDAVFRELPQPDDWFHADPILVEHAGEHFVFMEAFPYATARGLIAVSRLDSAGNFSAPQVVLERPYHLSYPFVFSWQGTMFMIPETSGNRTIELYRCERFPDRWVLDCVLLGGVEAGDATIFPYAGKLWMFVTLASRGLWLDTELHVFFADDVRGPWRPHPLNPVVSDVRCARPAGPIWEEGGRLIRPAQDCRLGYASAVSFQSITTLTPEDYVEEPLSRLTVNQLPWKPRAERVHSWCMNSRFVAIDSTVSRWRLNLK